MIKLEFFFLKFIRKKKYLIYLLKQKKKKKQYLEMDSKLILKFLMLL